ncbi:MAG: molybdopterin converting factor subunit 1 [Gammaproteobacteria bacterium]|nr:molybdopterin converting factor subunit 1 [Gammaproteobacteria bacterium]MDH5630204.1 molybdopterin converting factor subunit 1 [Gammaproteobacteria bacterium]
MIKILFFASLREQLGVAQIEFDLASPASIDEIKSKLIEKGDVWKKAFSRPLLVAVNQEIVEQDTLVSPSSEIAFFPPVTGG